MCIWTFTEKKSLIFFSALSKIAMVMHWVFMTNYTTLQYLHHRLNPTAHQPAVVFISLEDGER